MWKPTISAFLGNNSTKSWTPILGQRYLKLNFCMSDTPHSLRALVYICIFLNASIKGRILFFLELLFAAVLIIAANYCFHGSSYWQLSRRLKYKKAGFYWGDHSKLTSLPEFRLSMLFSLFSIFIAVIFLIRSSAVTFLFGAFPRTWMQQSKPSWNGNNQQCWKNSRPSWTTSWKLWRDSWRSLQTRKWAN